VKRRIKLPTEGRVMTSPVNERTNSGSDDSDQGSDQNRVVTTSIKARTENCRSKWSEQWSDDCTHQTQNKTWSHDAGDEQTNLE
jgi:hypothetical protein